ncbi:unnamed protein product [Calypogeia fissa]
MDLRVGSRGVKGGGLGKRWRFGSRKREELQYSDYSNDYSGLEQQEEQYAQEHHRVAHDEDGAWKWDDSGNETVIRSKKELSTAIKLGNLYPVQAVNILEQDMGSGHFTLAQVLAAGELCNLSDLQLLVTDLTEDRANAICKALASRKFPSLSRIDLGWNMIGSKGFKALGRAIQSRRLKNLTFLSLNDTGIDDDDMATLSTAFQHGRASVLPKLKRLLLHNNSFTEVGLGLLAEVLKSGRLDSLERVDVSGSSNPSQTGGNALVSALALNNRLRAIVRFEWHRFPDLDATYKQLRKQKEILRALLAHPKVSASYAKIYLCGSPMVGKTTLSHTLKRTISESLWTRERRPHLEARTRGIDVSKVFSSGFYPIENEITLLVWDMAGQQDYHLVHNSFFPDLSFSEGKATTFVIVCTSEDLHEAEVQLRYWLRYIASSCDKTLHKLRHVFVVLNNIRGDEKVKGYTQHWEKVLEAERQKFSGFLQVRTDPFLVDVRRRRKVEGLRKALLRHSRTLLKDERVPKLCQIMQEHLTTWSETRKQFPVLHWEDFVQYVCRFIAPWSKKTIEAATKYLNEVGVLIHIDRRFPPEWGITYQRLVILDPNWICRGVVGNIFLHKDMVDEREHKHLFRNKVNRTTGSILISDFKEFFRSSVGEWNESQFDDLITILLWLGLCYNGREQNVFIPALINENGELGDPWQPESMNEHGKGQWVMGFSVEHKSCEMTLAPMSLWHRFQVELAQTEKFNGEVLDNDFITGKTFMTFAVDYMNVHITVDAKEDIPTFDEISIFVKPISIDKWSGDRRKQRQVDLANDLLQILLGLWDRVCPTVEYLCRVVWPWPASQPRPRDKQGRNVEVAEVKKSENLFYRES